MSPGLELSMKGVWCRKYLQISWNIFSISDLSSIPAITRQYDHMLMNEGYLVHLSKNGNLEVTGRDATRPS